MFAPFLPFALLHSPSCAAFAFLFYFGYRNGKVFFLTLAIPKCIVMFKQFKMDNIWLLF